MSEPQVKTLALLSQEECAPGSSAMMFMRADGDFVLSTLVPGEGTKIKEVHAGKTRVPPVQSEVATDWLTALEGIEVSDKGFVTVIAKNVSDSTMILRASLQVTITEPKKRPKTAMVAAGRSGRDAYDDDKPIATPAMGKHIGSGRGMSARSSSAYGGAAPYGGAVSARRHLYRSANVDRQDRALQKIAREVRTIEAGADEIAVAMPSGVAAGVLRFVESNVRLPKLFRPVLSHLFTGALQSAQKTVSISAGEVVICLRPPTIHALMRAFRSHMFGSVEEREEVLTALRCGLGIEVIQAKAV